MDFVKEWLETAKEVLTQPSSFFENEDRRDGFGYPIKFAAVSFLIAGIIGAIEVIATGSGIGIGTAIGAVIGGLIGIVIWSAIVHLFVALLGGSGYGNTLAAYAYGTALAPISSALGLISLVPSLGTLGVGTIASAAVWLYGIYIYIQGLKAFQGLSTGRAALAVLLPTAIIVGLVVALVVLVAGAALAALGGGALAGV